MSVVDTLDLVEKGVEESEDDRPCARNVYLDSRMRSMKRDPMDPSEAWPRRYVGAGAARKPSTELLVSIRRLMQGKGESTARLGCFSTSDTGFLDALLAMFSMYKDQESFPLTPEVARGVVYVVLEGFMVASEPVWAANQSTLYTDKVHTSGDLFAWVIAVAVNAAK